MSGTVTIGGLAESTGLEFVDAPGRYVCELEGVKFGEASTGSPYVQLQLRVVAALDEDNADQVGRVLMDRVYFTQKALNRMALVASTFDLLTDEERQREWPGDERGLRELFEFLRDVFRHRVMTAVERRRPVEVELRLVPGRPRSVFNPDTGRVEQVPGDPELRVPFAGYRPVTEASREDEEEHFLEEA